jgi:hypothetical protein
LSCFPAIHTVGALPAGVVTGRLARFYTVYTALAVVIAPAVTTSLEAGVVETFGVYFFVHKCLIYVFESVVAGVIFFGFVAGFWFTVFGAFFTLNWDAFSFFTFFSFFALFSFFTFCGFFSFFSLFSIAADRFTVFVTFFTLDRDAFLFSRRWFRNSREVDLLGVELDFYSAEIGSMFAPALST